MRLLAATLLSLTLSFPLYARADDMLVDSQWLASHIDEPSLVIVDMSSDYTQYQRFHLPGAIYLPYDAIVQSGRDRVSRAVAPQRLAEVLGFFGIAADQHIVIYDDMGGLNASRLYWQLEQIGHEQISILNGGLVRWIREGRAVTGEPVSRPKRRYGAAGETHANLARLEDVLKAVEGGETVLIDARSREEYAGDPRHKRSGHIPGAIHYSWDTSVDFDAAFAMRSKAELEALLEQAGLDGNKKTPIITYCQSGHRAAHLYYTLKRLGYSQVRLYDGSMAEYRQHKGAPLKLGNRP